MQVLAVSQALPRSRHIEFGPIAVVRVITLVRASRKWAMPLREIRRLETLTLAVARRSAKPCSQ